MVKTFGNKEDMIMKKNIFTLAALLIASAAFIACSSSNDDITDQQPVSPTGKYIMTVKASKGDDAATRALEIDGTGTKNVLNAKWAAGEEVSVYEGDNLLGTLTPDPTTITNNDTECTLTGTLDTAPSASEVTLTLKFNTATINGQDGTLSHIASNNDYATAETTVTITGNKITGTDADFENKNAIARFTLKCGNTVITPSQLKISVTTTDQTVLAGLTAINKSLPTYTFTIPNETYTTNKGNFLYFALPTFSGICSELGLSSELIAIIENAAANGTIQLNITATEGSNSEYTYTKNSYPFAAGQYYEITVQMKNPGKFSVSSGKQVYFSKGNLQATTSNNGTTWTWQFGPTQYARVGDGANIYINGNGSVSNDGNGKYIDLFGWSTSTTYLGINNSTNNETYRKSGVTNGSDFVDWGSHADVTACIGSGWRTLTSNEWRYLMVTRTGNRYAKAQINGSRSGFILLPDDWKTGYYTLSNINDAGANFSGNNITSDNWTSILEAHGAVFLPVTGQRNSGTTVNNPDSELHYWSSTGGENSSHVPTGNQLKYATSNLAPDSGAGRCNGYAVRLVRDVQAQ